MIYLDNAATTLYKPRAVDEAVRRAMHAAAGYARGGYAAAARAGELVYGCREQAAALFGVRDPARVVFTMNATHALNLAIHALAKPGMRIAVGGYEHNAVMRPLTLRGIEPAVLDTPLWDAAGMERKARRSPSGSEGGSAPSVRFNLQALCFAILQACLQGYFHKIFLQFVRSLFRRELVCQIKFMSYYFAIDDKYFA